MIIMECLRLQLIDVSKDMACNPLLFVDMLSLGGL